MDLVDTLIDVRYWSEVLCCTIITHISDLEIKVTDFKFYVKIFGESFFYFSVMKTIKQIGGRSSVNLVILTCGS